MVRPGFEPDSLNSSKGALPLRYPASSWRNYQLQQNLTLLVGGIDSRSQSRMNCPIPEQTSRRMGGERLANNFRSYGRLPDIGCEKR